LYGAEQEGTRESNSLDALAHNPWVERTDVGGDIRQFRHAYKIAGRIRILATSLSRSREMRTVGTLKLSHSRRSRQGTAAKKSGSG